jgi:RepB plasmid partitioning protein
VVELLVASGNYSVPYVKTLFVATHPDMLIEPEKHKVIRGLTPEQVAKMENEMEGLHRDLKHIEESHGDQVLSFVLVRGYLTKLFSNSRVVRYLNQHHSDIFRELQSRGWTQRSSGTSEPKLGLVSIQPTNTTDAIVNSDGTLI